MIHSDALEPAAGEPGECTESVQRRADRVNNDQDKTDESSENKDEEEETINKILSGNFEGNTSLAGYFDFTLKATNKPLL